MGNGGCDRDEDRNATGDALRAVGSARIAPRVERCASLVPRLAFPNYKQRLLIRGAMPVSGGTRNQGLADAAGAALTSGLMRW